jgi:long-chain acyl-CoA synthetase
MNASAAQSLRQENWFKHYPPGVDPEINHSALTTIPAMLEGTIRKFPARTAFECMGSKLTFQQFDQLATALAAYLQGPCGMKKGDTIAIMLPNLLQFPVSFLAAQKAGIICVNTNPQYTAREMEHQFKDSGAKTIIILDLFCDKLEEIISRTQIKNVIVTSIGEMLSPLKGLIIGSLLRLKKMIPKHNLQHVRFGHALDQGKSLQFQRPDVKLDDVAILQYTGGTTGVPKAAMLTHSNIASNVQQVQMWAKGINITSDETILTALPLYHIFALSVNFLTFATLGGTSILVPKPVPIANTVKMFKKYPISVMTGVNTLFNTMNNDPTFQKLKPAKLKIALAGGMALQDSVNKRFKEITGIHIVEGFGMTESSPVTHANPTHKPGPSVSIGLPLPSTEAKIVDDSGQEVPVGETGELIVRGPQVMKGYWNKPEETAKTLKNGWLYTGDIAKRNEDGYFFIVDRKKDMILVSGFNVFPNEVEEVLSSHPKVLESAVIGVPNGENGEAVKAFIVPKDPSLTEAELREFCTKQLTNYKRPKSYVFRQELPKSNVGKILRKVLRDESH